MTTRRASCSCGQLSATTEGEPIRISVCHCLACQLRRGSAFGVQARFPRDQVRIEGPASQYVRVADSGICPECGATVQYYLAQFPDGIAIPVGAFGDPAFPSARFSVYESRRHDWLGMPEGIRRFD